MKLLMLILFGWPLATFGQTTVAGSLAAKLATNWIKIPPTGCTNYCCRDKWPTTAQWEGTIVTNVVVVLTNKEDRFTIRIDEFPRATAYTRPKRTLPYDSIIDEIAIVQKQPTNLVISATLE